MLADFMRVETPADVAAVAAQLRGAGIAASDAKLYPVYTPDYWPTYFTDPDGIRLAVTNYRQECRERHDHW
jgi:glyoxylase I family protein